MALVIWASCLTIGVCAGTTGALLLTNLLAPSTAQHIVAAPAKAKMEPWEHGWRTDRVIGTRMRSDFLGYNIKIELPKDPYECDRAELFGWFGDHGGNVIEGGGAPAAPMYVIFPDVKDRDSADRKLQEILPPFSAFVVELLGRK